MTPGRAIQRAVAAGPGLAGLVLAGLVLAGLGLAGLAAAEAAGPAELPPKDYAGQQYVDSRGCLFLRADAKGSEVWVPRVTRDGVPLCDNPPSGRRVPVLEEGVEADFTPDRPTTNP